DFMRTAAIPDCILLDLRMPVMDGWEFRLEQTHDPHLAGIPVIVMSGDGDDEGNFNGLIGPITLLRKPIEPKSFLEAVKRVVCKVAPGRSQGVANAQLCQ